MNCSGGFTKAHCCCCAKLHQRRQPGKCFRKVAAALPCKTLFREGMAASPRSKSLERSLTKAQVRWPTSRPISHINHLPCVARCRKQKPSTWVGAAASSRPEHPLMGCTLDLPDAYPSVATFARYLVYPQALVAQDHHHVPASSLARDIVSGGAVPSRQYGPEHLLSVRRFQKAITAQAKEKRETKQQTHLAGVYMHTSSTNLAAAISTSSAGTTTSILHKRDLSTQQLPCPRNINTLHPRTIPLREKGCLCPSPTKPKTTTLNLEVVRCSLAGTVVRSAQGHITAVRVPAN